MTRAAAAVFVAWIACGPTAAAQERTVTLWHAYGEEEAAGLRAAVDAFRSEHPDVTVRLVHNAFGAYASKLESAIPSGRGPDLFIDAHERLGTYREAGLVAPLPSPPINIRLDFDVEHLEVLSAEGQLYGLPMSVKCAALYLNEELAPDDPRSFEELTSRSMPEGTYPIVFEAESSYYDAAFLHAFGGSLLAADGQWAFEGEPAQQTLALLVGLTQRGVVPEEPNGDLVKQLFRSGRAAAAISGPWLAPGIGDEVEYRVVPLPILEAADGAQLRPFVTIEGIYVADNAAEPELARALAEFLTTTPGATIRAVEGRQVVASRSAWEDARLAEDDFLRTFRAAASLGRPMDTHPHMRLAFEPAEKAIRKVLRGDADAEVALAEAQRRFDDMTRPPPPARDPTLGIAVIGFLLLLMVVWAARRARSPQFRTELRASLPAYRYVAHAFVAVGLLVIAPLTVGAATSFFAGRGTDLHYVGLANYVEILTARGGELLGHGSFWLVLLVTVLWTVLNIALHVVLGVALALLLNRPKLRLKGAYRVLLILPWAVPNYVTALSWKGLFHRQFGAINAILEALGAEPVSWFGQFATAFSANLVTNVWLGFPFMMVVTLGALSTIPKDLYEAAAVDGASAWQRFKLITVPMLKPMLLPAVAMGAIWTFNMFNVVFLVSGGEPDGSTEILVSEAYRWAFTRGAQYGYAAAYAVLIFVILLLGTRGISRRLDGMGGTA